MLTLILALLSGMASDPAPALPGWMAGCWIEQKGEGWAEECWTAPRGGIMLGSSRTGQGTTLRNWETMQIIVTDEATNAKMSFYAAPGGQGRTAFVWQPNERQEMVFYNLANDYPQRIRYWRDGAALNAEVSLADGSKPMRWSFRRQG